MLWPLPREVTEPEFGDVGVRYGFIDEAASLVVEPKYLTFDYCVAGGRPVRVVAARVGAIDVLELSGTLTRTITVLSTRIDPERNTSLWCRDNRTVEITDGIRRVRYSLASGSTLYRGRMSGTNTWCQSEDAPEEPYLPPTLPVGYPVDVGAGWAANEAETQYVNIETRAVVAGTECAGVNGLLVCPGRHAPAYYDKFGQLTIIAAMDWPELGDCSSQSLRAAPSYLWASGGGVQGYVDSDAVWHYQESAYLNVGD